MEALTQLYDQKSFKVADKHYPPADNLHSFADTNAMLRYSDSFNQPLIHFWTLEQTIILGMMDTKLPFFKKGLAVLDQANAHYFVRNSGGLAVASDDGILNVSLFLPHYKDAGIEAAYALMVQWIQAAFPKAAARIKAYEITRSYCPGAFDVSISGQKFGGISQRRVQNGVVVMLYLSVNGDQAKRGTMLKNFYAQGLQGLPTKWQFPDIDPGVMANLGDLLERPLTIAAVKQAMLAVFAESDLLSDAAFAPIEGEPEYQMYFDKALNTLTQRNIKDLS